MWQDFYLARKKRFVIVWPEYLLQRGKKMAREGSATVIMPPVYELYYGGFGHFWRWCKMKEICAAVPGIAKRAGNEFTPTPEELVDRFAALTRRNRLPERLRKDGVEFSNTKIFRYSIDGISFSGTKVPCPEKGTDYPPYSHFELEAGMPYPENLFVTEEWALATLNAIRMGAIAAVDFGEIQLGFPPANKEGLVHLGGKKEGIAVRIPERLFPRKTP